MVETNDICARRKQMWLECGRSPKRVQRVRCANLLEQGSDNFCGPGSWKGLDAFSEVAPELVWRSPSPGQPLQVSTDVHHPLPPSCHYTPFGLHNPSILVNVSSLRTHLLPAPFKYDVSCQCMRRAAQSQASTTAFALRFNNTSPLPNPEHVVCHRSKMIGYQNGVHSSTIVFL